MYLLLRVDPKAKAKTRKRTLAGLSTRTVPIGERTWADIEPQDYSPIAYPVSKQLITLLRRGHLPREEDGEIEFWRLKADLRNKFEHSQHGSDENAKEKNGRRLRPQEKINIVLILQEQFWTF